MLRVPERFPVRATLAECISRGVTRQELGALRVLLDEKLRVNKLGNDAECLTLGRSFRL